MPGGCAKEPLLPPGSQNSGANRLTGVKTLTSVKAFLFPQFFLTIAGRGAVTGQARIPWISMGSEPAEHQKMPFITRAFRLALKVQLSSARTDKNRAVRRNQCRYKPTSH